MKSITLVVAMIFVFGCAALAQTIVPVNGVMPTLTTVTINGGAGDQSDPHVSGDWVSYTSDISIRYYNFVTNTDAEIPMGNSNADLLSDVSGSKIVFSRVISGVRTAVMVFDAAAPGLAPIEIDAALGTTRLSSAIGGSTVAYIDFGLEANGELVIHDLTTSSSVRITNDTNPDQSPQVSPDGNVVVWEHCNASLSNCDVWQAVRSGAVWNTGIVANSINAESNPDTNGSLVVFDSIRAGEPDLYWRPVTGGGEVQLVMPGFQKNPSIVGNFIAFESSTTLSGKPDLYVYDLVANQLFQITNTPLVTEQLNDIALLPNGDLRVVWASDEDGSSSRNVKAATFTLTPPCTLGTTLPRALEATITQGGAPNYADTYVTPYTASQAGLITNWKAEFSGGLLINGGIGVPSGIQLKVLRYVTPTTVRVVAVGQVHDPRPPLQTTFGASYPYFLTTDSVLQFSESGLGILSGDIIGLTIKSDPAVGGYFYPLVSPGGTRIVLRDVAAGSTINLSDAYTGTLGWTPALEVNSCSTYDFAGFFQPVDNLPVINVTTAGQAIPVKFSLNGNMGLDIFAAGYPASSQIACDANAPGDVIEETVTAGGSTLTYDAATDRYNYVWKTQKAWKGTCRIFALRLKDGSDHFAKFRFK